MKVSPNKSILCKWCQNLLPFSLATPPSVSVCLLSSSSLISHYHLLPLLGMAGWRPVPSLQVKTNTRAREGLWFSTMDSDRGGGERPSLPESCWLSFGYRMGGCWSPSPGQPCASGNLCVWSSGPARSQFVSSSFPEFVVSPLSLAIWGFNPFRNRFS